ncbi:recombinase family protein [Sporolactobacillus sp. KGMB 08714]|uniref:recombinase family protein n=1 Tax=Sporolactobacillus sp. KGMB 08714 TaxID=3064704 RepID=UPI002FBDF919
MRVSTRSQYLESQIKDLKKSGHEKIFSEKLTGTKKARPEFQGSYLRFCKKAIL